jgi:hypothetical protein
MASFHAIGFHFSGGDNKDNFLLQVQYIFACVYLTGSRELHLTEAHLIVYWAAINSRSVQYAAYNNDTLKHLRINCFYV